MGIVKISDEMHDEVRKASAAMVRSINAQAEFWLKIGMLAEANPQLTFSEIIREQMNRAAVDLEKVSLEQH
ncbi:ParD-like family protein [Saccharospirillum sp. HFRX-1]|uniref:ParD-like family protein n=1 Tax=unclassified Saccharospirillum TaxID=2633430 RepID=UPI003713FDFE